MSPPLPVLGILAAPPGAARPLLRCSKGAARHTCPSCRPLTRVATLLLVADGGCCDQPVRCRRRPRRRQPLQASAGLQGTVAPPLRRTPVFFWLALCPGSLAAGARGPWPGPWPGLLGGCVRDGTARCRAASAAQPHTAPRQAGETRCARRPARVLCVARRSLVPKASNTRLGLGGKGPLAEVVWVAGALPPPPRSSWSVRAASAVSF